MLSLPFHVTLHPNASAPHNRTMGVQRQLLSPLAITKRDSLKATKTGIACEKHDKKLNEETALVGEDELPAGLKRELMPKHVAVILDGNRRWAQKQGLTTSEGHEAGAKRLIELAKVCSSWGMQSLSAFAFSTENWGRPENEVNYLMNSFEKYLKSEIPTLQREGIKVSIIGRTSQTPKSLHNSRSEVEEATKDNLRAHVILAIDYSGRYDILQACRSIAQKAKDGLIQVEDVNESLMDQELETKCVELPNPDLLVRTSGEHRISNFYLWQIAYTELFFSPVLWPEFGKDELVEALTSYQRRERRFGRRV